MHSIGWAMLALAFSGDPVLSSDEVHEVQTRNFKLPIRISPEQQEKVELVRLYVSVDQGKTWKLKQDYRPTGEIVYKTTRDGPYWFAIQAVHVDGTKEPADLRELAICRKVNVKAEVVVHQVNSRRFALPIVIPANQRGKVERLKLHVSEDLGKTWRHTQDYQPGDTAAIDLPRDGEFWFVLQVVYNDRTQEPAEVKNFRAHQKVNVKTAGAGVFGDWLPKNETPLTASRLPGGIPPPPGFGAAPEPPQTASAFLYRGNTRWGQGDFERAIADYTEAIRLSPKDAELYRTRGNAWSHRREFEKAVADYSELIHLAPKDLQAHIGRGALLTYMKKFDDALADYDAAIRLNPSNAETYKSRGHLLSHRGELDKAVADYTNALRFAPKDIKVYENRGVLLMQIRKYDDALADFETMIRLDPKHADGYAGRGIVWIAKRELDQAIAEFDEAIRLAPRLAEAYLYRGRLWHAKGDLRKAVADFDAALRLKPSEFDAYFLRGQLHGERGDYQKAAADFTRYIEHYPQEGRGYGMRALAVFAQGETKRAWADVAKARDLDADDSELSEPD